MKTVIIIEGDEDVNVLKIKRNNPLIDGWFCPYCGKRVYSMEIHPCTQPYCGGAYA